ncbi:MAG: YitT family protein [Eubacteriales bacterium]
MPAKQTHSHLKEILPSFLLVLLGAAVYGFSVQYFFVPAKLLSGGMTGIALILKRLLGFPVGITIIALNIPLFGLGWKNIGRKFFCLSLIGVIVSSVLIDVFANFLPTLSLLSEDRLLASALGGAMSGLGLGLCLSGGGSTGGIDILASIFSRKNAAVSTGRFILITDILLIAVGAFIFNDISSAMYTAVATYISSVMLDAVLYGQKLSAVVFIITSSPDELSKTIMSELRRGVTIVNAKGAYTGKDQGMLVCAAARRQLAQLKHTVKRNDPDAFVIVGDAREIVGNGFRENL